MKKFISLTVSIILCFSILAGCQASNTPPATASEPNTVEIPATPTTVTPSPATPSPSPSPSPEPETPNTPESIKVSALRGPTAMGMVKLMNDSENNATELNYEFSLATIDELVPLVSKGEVDIAAIPANLASVLYNNTQGKIKVLAINTLGVLYVVEKGDSIQSVEDLKGKTILAAGKGAIPEFALNYVLSQNGIDPVNDITIEYKSEPAEILPLLVQGTADIAIIPQPFVTNAMAKVEGLRIALDWTEEWDNVAEDGSVLITGSMVVNAEFADEYPEAVEIFAKEYEASTQFSNTNVDEAAGLIGQYGIVDAAIAKIALPMCNITYIDGEQMKENFSGYLNVLFEQSPQAVGGSLPDDEFYIK